MTTTRTCPDCAETIQPSAAKCPACGSNQPAPGEAAGGSPATLDVGPAGVFVVAGALLGFALGAPLLGGLHSLCVLLGAALGWGLFAVVARQASSAEADAPEAEAAAEVKPAAEPEAVKPAAEPEAAKSEAAEPEAAESEAAESEAAAEPEAEAAEQTPEG